MSRVCFKITHCLSLPEQSTTDLAASTTVIYSLPVPEAGCPRQRGQHGWLLPRPLPQFGNSHLLPDLHIIFLLDAHPQCLFVQISSYYKDISHMGLGPTLVTSLTLFLKINLFIYLFLAVSGLRCCMQAFSSCSERGATLCCSAQASHCSGFSCCGARALGTRASVVVTCGLSSCGAQAQ